MSPRSPFSLLLLGLAFAALAAGRARAEEITTDRPDFVESADVVPHVQIEAGLESTLDKHDGLQTRTLTTPTLLRIALSRRFEFRLETDGYADATTTGAPDGSRVHAQGMADTAIGIKWHVQDSVEGGAPAMAWLFDGEAPSGAAAFRGRGWRPSVRFVSEWELENDWTVGMMPGISLDRTDDGHEFANGLFAVTVGQGFAPHWDAFVELAAQQIAAQRYGGNIVTFDTGIAHRVTDDFQIDAAAFFGLTHEAPALQWGLGASFRF